MSEYSHDEAIGALDALYEAEGPLQDGADDCLQIVRSYIDTLRGASRDFVEHFESGGVEYIVSDDARYSRDRLRKLIDRGTP